MPLARRRAVDRAAARGQAVDNAGLVAIWIVLMVTLAASWFPRYHHRRRSTWSAATHTGDRSQPLTTCGPRRAVQDEVPHRRHDIGGPRRYRLSVMAAIQSFASVTAASSDSSRPPDAAALA